MTDVTIGLMGLAILLALFMTGIELSFAMAIVGFVGFGTIMMSPGAVIACAMLAKPSFDPSVATTWVSGSSFTPNRRS